MENINESLDKKLLLTLKPIDDKFIRVTKDNQVSTDAETVDKDTPIWRARIPKIVISELEKEFVKSKII